MADSLPMPLTRDQQAALRLMLDSYRPLENEYAENYRGIESAKRYIEATELRQQQINAEAHQMQAVALRMGLNLFQAAEAARNAEIEGEVDADPSPRIAEPGGDALSPKVFVFEQARRAYPKPVRASDLNRQLKELGISVHSKTVGMSLYRFSKQGYLRRDGLDWYFIPESERGSDPPSDAEDYRDYA